MKIKLGKIFFLFLISSLLLNSCSKKTQSPENNFKNGKVTVYFTKPSKELGVVLIPVVRKISKGSSAYQTAIKELFLGPTLEEREKLELNSEIPEGSRLINIVEENDSVKIDISSQFMYGGGSESMQVRFRQFRETALTLAKGRPVYLYIDGTLATKIGGEGLEVQQPLNKKNP